MYYLLYASSATRLFSDKELFALLETSRKNNASRQVTGMLLYKDGNFMQVLEGEETTVHEVFIKISRDPRHRGILNLTMGHTKERQFPSWSMGFRNLNSPEALSLPGYSEFLNASLAGEEFVNDPTRCQKLLLIFKRELR